MSDLQFISAPDPENPGWFTWQLLDERRYNNQVLGKMLVRPDGEGRARLRMFGLIEAGTAVTLDLSTQFLGAGAVDIPLDAEVELLRETKRLLFLRGLVVQGNNRIAAFAGTIRKPTVR